MSTDNIADPHLGVRSQARAVLAMLDREPDFAEYKDGYYNVEIQSFAWYNGREKGVALVLYRYGYKGCLVVTFGEARSSDEIFVDSWEMDRPPMNGPTVKDFSEESYQNRRHFACGAAGEAADFIYRKMAAFYENMVQEEAGRPAIPSVYDRIREGKILAVYEDI